MANDWNEHQVFESDFWGNCVNTINEELKQFTYAKHMGLVMSYDYDRASPYSFDIENKKILDVGGGPTSLLLKCRNAGNMDSLIIDPCKYPSWVSTRYHEAKFRFWKMKGEELDEIADDGFDEVWMYNVIQHTEDPYKIVNNMKLKTKYIRIFEWCTKPHKGHPIETNKEFLDSIFGVNGNTGILNGENQCYGTYWAYYGEIK